MTLRDEIDALCRRIAAAGVHYSTADSARLNCLLLDDAVAAGVVAEPLTGLVEVGVMLDRLIHYGYKWEQDADAKWRLVEIEQADEPLIVVVRQSDTL